MKETRFQLSEDQKSIAPNKKQGKTTRCSTSGFTKPCRQGFVCQDGTCKYTGELPDRQTDWARKLSSFLNALVKNKQLTIIQKNQIIRKPLMEKKAVQLINGEITIHQYVRSADQQIQRRKKQEEQYYREHPEQRQY